MLKFLLVLSLDAWMMGNIYRYIANGFTARRSRTISIMYGPGRHNERGKHSTNFVRKTPTVASPPLDMM